MAHVVSQSSSQLSSPPSSPPSSPLAPPAGSLASLPLAPPAGSQEDQEHQDQYPNDLTSSDNKALICTNNDIFSELENKTSDAPQFITNQIMEAKILYENAKFYYNGGEFTGSLVSYSCASVLLNNFIQSDAAHEPARSAAKKILNCCLNAVEELQGKVKRGSGGNNSKKDDEDGEKDWGKICTKIHPLVFKKGSSDCIFFRDVAGLEKEKTLMENSLIYPLMYPNLYPKASKGLLIYGPPGTGKTYLVKAAVNALQKKDKSIGVLFFTPSPGDLKGKYVGEAEKRIEETFTCASRAACEHEYECPSKKKFISIIFMDEMDAIGPNRDTDTTGLAANSVNTLLQMMDGVKSFSNVAVIGATNYPWDLDAAILRRFDTQILIDLPTESDIKKLLEISMNDMINLDLSREGSTSSSCNKSSDKKQITNGLTGCELECDDTPKPLLYTTDPYTRFNIEFFTELKKRGGFVDGLANILSSKNFSNSDVNRLLKAAATNAGQLAVSSNLFYSLHLIKDFTDVRGDKFMSCLTNFPKNQEDEAINTSKLILKQFIDNKMRDNPNIYQMSAPENVYVICENDCFFNLKCLFYKTEVLSLLQSPGIKDVYVKLPVTVNNGTLDVNSIDNIQAESYKQHTFGKTSFNTNVPMDIVITFDLTIKETSDSVDFSNYLLPPSKTLNSVYSALKNTFDSAKRELKADSVEQLRVVPGEKTEAEQTVAESNNQQLANAVTDLNAQLSISKSHPNRLAYLQGQRRAAIEEPALPNPATPPVNAADSCITILKGNITARIAIVDAEIKRLKNLKNSISKPENLLLNELQKELSQLNKYQGNLPISRQITDLYIIGHQLTLTPDEIRELLDNYKIRTPLTDPTKIKLNDIITNLDTLYKKKGAVTATLPTSVEIEVFPYKPVNQKTYRPVITQNTPDCGTNLNNLNTLITRTNAFLTLLNLFKNVYDLLADGAKIANPLPGASSEEFVGAKSKDYESVIQPMTGDTYTDKVSAFNASPMYEYSDKACTAVLPATATGAAAAQAAPNLFTNASANGATKDAIKAAYDAFDRLTNKGQFYKEKSLSFSPALNAFIEKGFSDFECQKYIKQYFTRFEGHDFTFLAYVLLYENLVNYQIRPLQTKLDTLIREKQNMEASLESYDIKTEQLNELKGKDDKDKDRREALAIKQSKNAEEEAELTYYYEISREIDELEEQLKRAAPTQQEIDDKERDIVELETQINTARGNTDVSFFRREYQGILGNEFLKPESFSVIDTNSDISNKLSSTMKSIIGADVTFYQDQDSKFYYISVNAYSTLCNDYVYNQLGLYNSLPVYIDITQRAEDQFYNTVYFKIEKNLFNILFNTQLPSLPNLPKIEDSMENPPFQSLTGCLIQLFIDDVCKFYNLLGNVGGEDSDKLYVKYKDLLLKAYFKKIMNVSNKRDIYEAISVRLFDNYKFVTNQDNLYLLGFQIDDECFNVNTNLNNNADGTAANPAASGAAVNLSVVRSGGSNKTAKNKTHVRKISNSAIRKRVAASKNRSSFKNKPDRLFNYTKRNKSQKPVLKYRNNNIIDINDIDEQEGGARDNQDPETVLNAFIEFVNKVSNKTPNLPNDATSNIVNKYAYVRTQFNVEAASKIRKDIQLFSFLDTGNSIGGVLLDCLAWSKDLFHSGTGQTAKEGRETTKEKYFKDALDNYGKKNQITAILFKEITHVGFLADRNNQKECEDDKLLVDRIKKENKERDLLIEWVGVGPSTNGYEFFKTIIGLVVGIFRLKLSDVLASVGTAGVNIADLIPELISKVNPRWAKNLRDFGKSASSAASSGFDSIGGNALVDFIDSYGFITIILSAILVLFETNPVGWGVAFSTYFGGGWIATAGGAAITAATSGAGLVTNAISSIGLGTIMLKWAAGLWGALNTAFAIFNGCKGDADIKDIVRDVLKIQIFNKLTAIRFIDTPNLKGKSAAELFKESMRSDFACFWDNLAPFYDPNRGGLFDPKAYGQAFLDYFKNILKFVVVGAPKAFWDQMTLLKNSTTLITIAIPPNYNFKLYKEIVTQDDKIKSLLVNLNIPNQSFAYALTVVKSTYVKQSGKDLRDYYNDKDKFMEEYKKRKKGK